MSQALLFIVFRGLEIKKKVEGNSKSIPTPSFVSHGSCDLALYICTSYIYIYTSFYVLLKILKSNYKRKTSNDA